MLFGRRLEQQNHQLADSNKQAKLPSSKLNNIITHFWECWRREYLTALRERNTQCTDRKNCPMINTGDVIIKDKYQPRSSLRIAKS